MEWDVIIIVSICLFIYKGIIYLFHPPKKVDEKPWEKYGIETLPNGEPPVGIYVSGDTWPYESVFPYYYKTKEEFYGIDGHFFSSLPMDGKKIYIDLSTGMSYIEHDHRLIAGRIERPKDFMAIGRVKTDYELEKEKRKLIKNWYKEMDAIKDEILYDEVITERDKEKLMKQWKNKLGKGKYESTKLD
ncbi:hypothetical protein [Streptococcus halotolerans]|uniref:hypothetical protein n=1 Tax=Streptococcus halotolerans TaxID=1814128 RepID=UPI000786D441|nr:hypothetical protein [Streptococcus halotolerans]